MVAAGRYCIAGDQAQGCVIGTGIKARQGRGCRRCEQQSPDREADGRNPGAGVSLAPVRPPSVDLALPGGLHSGREPARRLGRDAAMSGNADPGAGRSR